MQKTKLHAQGPELSRLIAGVWRWTNASAAHIEKLVHTALENGISTFDHADIYGNYTCEENFGNVLRSNASLRNKLQIITKFGIKLLSDKRPDHAIKHYDASAAHCIRSVENSLQALRTDRIDVLLIHRPDPLLNPTEVAEAFSKLKREGKVLYFGVSNFTTSQVEMLQSYLPFPLVTNQIELSLFKSAAFFNGDTDVMMRYKIKPMAWSPLGGGKYFENEPVKSLLDRLAKEYSVTTTQLLLAWLLKHPTGVLPILGTTKPERIIEGAGAINVKLNRQHWFEMLQATTGKGLA